MDQWLLEACKFLALWGGMKIWACHLRCQILYKAPTQSQTGARLTRLYISPPAPHTTLKYVLKSVLFIQTHLNPSQVPCFASVWQVLGFLACEGFSPCPTQRCKKAKSGASMLLPFPPQQCYFLGCVKYMAIGHSSNICIVYMYHIINASLRVQCGNYAFSVQSQIWMLANHAYVVLFFWPFLMLFASLAPVTPPPPPNPILRRDKCVGEKCTWIYSAQPGTGTERRYLTLFTITSLLIQYLQSIQSKSLQ